MFVRGLYCVVLALIYLIDLKHLVHVSPGDYTVFYLPFVDWDDQNPPREISSNCLSRIDSQETPKSLTGSDGESGVAG